MSKMSLVEAAQQALEALKMMRDAYEEYACPACDHADAAIYALKAALAEHFCDTHCTWADHVEGCVKAGPVQEPVAWMDIDSDGQRLSVRQWSDGNRDEVPLYTAPPQRKPLTDEEILSISAECAASHQHDDVHLARAIERAHGIGGSNE